ncbi:hypothetical protein FGO68_gene9335 [Halteria grandinella]|uniref:Uncharacterized protein n=1 Tax=Halteria grandinella TaxID=5974 RepID=A0A8J8NX10_HALGN|nr:hypothetical protein FGO68_gene9335 [Halteria grandinella]
MMPWAGRGPKYSSLESPCEPRPPPLVMAFTLKLMTVRPICTALLQPGIRGVRCLMSTRVPNLERLSSRQKRGRGLLRCH